MTLRVNSNDAIISAPATNYKALVSPVFYGIIYKGNQSGNVIKFNIEQLRD